MVIAPGGGFTHVTIDKEGADVARWLNRIGVAGFVLKYRLPKTEEAGYTIDTALSEDTQLAFTYRSEPRPGMGRRSKPRRADGLFPRVVHWRRWRGRAFIQAPALRIRPRINRAIALIFLLSAMARFRKT